MQRYGPPPSYPNLKIPGLNTPLPESGNYNFLYNKPLEDVPLFFIYFKFDYLMKAKFSYDVFGRPTMKDKDNEDENQKFGI
jgi:splicing factor 3B subunit 2